MRLWINFTMKSPVSSINFIFVFFRRPVKSAIKPKKRQQQSKETYNNVKYVNQKEGIRNLLVKI